MPGYYSGLLEGMQGAQQIKASQTMQAERQQTIQMNAQNMALQQQERQLMMQAFQGGAEARSGMEDADSLNAAAKKMAAVGQRIMGLDPAKGISMLREAGTLRQQASQQGLRNIEIAQKKNELLGNTATLVQDQTSLNDAVMELSKEGVVVPPKYRQWNPESQKWWNSRAAISKKNIELMRIDQSEQRTKIAADAETRKEAEGKVKAGAKDREDELKRHGEYMKGYKAIQSEYDKATKAGDKLKANEYAKQMWKANREYQGKPTDWRQDPEVTRLIQDVKDKTLSEEEFTAKMKALGYE
jgi:hypothetical protein